MLSGITSLLPVCTMGAGTAKSLRFFCLMNISVHSFRDVAVSLVSPVSTGLLWECTKIFFIDLLLMLCACVAIVSNVYVAEKQGDQVFLA